MKRVLIGNPTDAATSTALLIARIGIGLMMLVHGLPKMAMLFSGEPIQFLPVFGLSAEVSLALAVFAEVFCSLLLLVGLGTRLAVIPLIITMLVAVFIYHAPDPFAKQELGLLYLLVYLLLLFTGAGKFSLDYLLQQRSASVDYARVKNTGRTVSSY